LRRFQAVVLFGGLALVLWFMLTGRQEVVLARNLLLYRAEGVWRVAASPGSGQLSGRVLGAAGTPLGGATVLAADAVGRTFSVESDARGAYTLVLPGGAYVPLATSACYDDATLRVGTFRRSLFVAPGTTTYADFALSRAAPRAQNADQSVQFSDEALVHGDIAPAGSQVSFGVR